MAKLFLLILPWLMIATLVSAEPAAWSLSDDPHGRCTWEAEPSYRPCLSITEAEGTTKCTSIVVYARKSEGAHQVLFNGWYVSGGNRSFPAVEIPGPAGQDACMCKLFEQQPEYFLWEDGVPCGKGAV